MKTVRRKLVFINVLAMWLFSTCMFAQTCSYKVDCHNTNNCGNPCTITVGYGGVTGVSQDPVCVSRGTVIKFVEAQMDYGFRVTFKDTIQDPTDLFTDNRVIFSGYKASSSSLSDSDTVDNGAGDCYEYNLTQCQGATPCVTGPDPKVIVNGGGGGGTNAKKPKS